MKLFRKLIHRIKSIFKKEHQCMFDVREVVNLKITPHCVHCGKPLEKL